MLGGVFSHVGLPDGKVRKGTLHRQDRRHGQPDHPGALTTSSSRTSSITTSRCSPTCQPLATTEYDGTAWPVAWTRTYGKGRVFHTPLGHRDFGPGKDDPLRNPNLLKLIIQGVDWVAAGKTAHVGAIGR